MKAKLPRLDCSCSKAQALADEGQRRRMAAGDYHTLHHAARKLTLLKWRPLPGRTHQLRVHCARGLDRPILANVTYVEPDLNGHGAAVVEGLLDTLRAHARSTCRTRRVGR